MQTIALVVLVALFVAAYVTHRRHAAGMVCEWYTIQFISCFLAGWPVQVAWDWPAAKVARQDFLETFLMVLLLASPLWLYYRTDGLWALGLAWLGYALYQAASATDARGRYRDFFFGLVVALCITMPTFAILWMAKSLLALVVLGGWYCVAAGFILWPWLITCRHIFRRGYEVFADVRATWSSHS